MTVESPPFLIDQLCLASNLSFEKETGQHHHWQTSIHVHFHSNLFDYGAVHILRQPPEGGEGVWKMLTIADEGWRGGKPKADHC